MRKLFKSVKMFFILIWAWLLIGLAEKCFKLEFYKIAEFLLKYATNMTKKAQKSLDNY